VSSVIWISIAIGVALLVALAVGLLLARRRRISIAEKPAQQVEAPPTPRRYQAGGSISFSAGGGGPPAPPQAAAPPQPPTPAQASAPAPPKPPVQEPPAAPESPAPARPRASAPAPSRPPAQAPSRPAKPKPKPKPKRRPAAPAPPTDLAPPPGVAPAAPAKPQPVEAAPAPAPVEPAPPETAPAEPIPAAVAPAAPVPVEPVPAEPVPAEPVPAEPVPAEPAGALVEPIDAPAGRLVRLRGRLARSRSAFGQSLLGLLGAGDLDEDSWVDVEDTLLLADLGAATTTEIVDRLRAELAARGVRTAEQARAALRDVLIEALRPELDRAVRALPHNGADGASVPGVVLIAGVNGTGKTTTTGKLARVLVADGRRVLLGAADTFRAAAVEQLATWGERAGAEVVRGAEGADPASVAFEAVKQGSANGVDTVLIDTAGRLHTKTGLMDELGKVKRVVSKQTEVDEVLLVLDATTGQNGIMQARVFREVVEVTGIVLTKLDGTAKGGIVFHVQRELGVPVKLVGLGEGVDDLAPFEPAAFVDALLD
jgi:fused signal recognition particle receptor